MIQAKTEDNEEGSSRPQVWPSRVLCCFFGRDMVASLENQLIERTTGQSLIRYKLGSCSFYLFWAMGLEVFSLHIVRFTDRQCGSQVRPIRDTQELGKKKKFWPVMQQASTHSRRMAFHVPVSRNTTQGRLPCEPAFRVKLGGEGRVLRSDPRGRNGAACVGWLSLGRSACAGMIPYQLQRRQ